MLQRFAQFRVALAEFLEQPHVFDGDDRLVSEGFDKCNLPLGKRFHYVAPNYDDSDGRSLSE